MTSKRARQRAILELIRESRIDSQESLAEKLHEKGFTVSQSTLSRDIQELGIAKAGHVYTAVSSDARRSSDQTLRLVLREFVVQVDGVEHILVIKTGSGSAAPVSQALDDAAWPEVVGTIAGENTIFVLCRTPSDVRRLQERIEEFLT